MPIILLCEWVGTHCPVFFVRLRYYARFRKKLDLDNPQTLNEKILYLSLLTDTSLWTRCADKYAVRAYVEEKGLGDILIPLVGVWHSAEEVDFDALPTQFVMKANHGSGDVLIVEDKKKIDESEVKRCFSKVLSQKYGALEGGLHYMRIKPVLIAEELIRTDSGTSLVDYKCWCFNGKCCYIWTCANRDEHSTEVMTYDRQWVAHPEYSIYNEGYRQGELIAKPANLDYMIEVAERLSQDFECVRVDLYNVGGKVYFGELTFTCYGGMMDFYTDEFQAMAGGMVDISMAK